MDTEMLDGTLALAVCRGASGGYCRFALPFSDGEAELLAEAASRSGWPEFLLDKTGGKPHAHQALRVSVSACANGCARPHIADFGLIRSETPEVQAENCISCGLCVEACPDNAVTVAAKSPAVIDYEACLSCGRCERACPTGVITATCSGYRILVGGRLGRRPKLAREIPGIRCLKDSVALFEDAIKAIMTNHEYGIRYGTILDSWQPDETLACV